MTDLTLHLRGQANVNRRADAIVPCRYGDARWLTIHHEGTVSTLSSTLTLFLDEAMIEQLVEAALELQT